MADHLASIYGTEKDKVHCSFYFKIGACRHGEKCARKHVKPNFSQTLLMPNLYANPSHQQPDTCTMTSNEIQADFDLFYEDMYLELAKYGEIEELNICDNIGDHLVGNVYCRYKYEEDAGKAVESLNNRFYSGRPIYAELCPVTDFSEACCRQYDTSECLRGGFCNFMHVKQPDQSLKRELKKAQRLTIKILKPRPEESDEESRSRSPHRSRHRESDRDSGRSRRHGDRHRDDRRSRY